MNTKSLLTNLVCAILALSGYFFEYQVLLMAGLFGLSGALTNHLAVYMLFEKVPLLYGSGVIQLRFEAFKDAVKGLIMDEFFTLERFNLFFEKRELKLDLVPLIKQSDLAPAFLALKKSVMSSSFGGMLGMFGGEKALDGLQSPFESKLKVALVEMVETKTFKEQVKEHLQQAYASKETHSMIEEMIEERLATLTPVMVKEMVERLIHEHLGWLVVWGGFFGGTIGLLGSVLL
ncbi:MAG: DUF445 domain-containing protein [Campylobacteraceae bacterium]|nr:DUF445 domain-containing protein [Campylobacteraceae bacterium]